jgi:hypothetical protein
MRVVNQIRNEIDTSAGNTDTIQHITFTIINIVDSCSYSPL